MNIRLTHAEAIGNTGEPRTAADLATKLADDCAHRLGQTHLTTLEARHLKAKWTARTGNQASARAEYASLHDDNHWLAQEIQTQHKLLQDTSE